MAFSPTLKQDVRPARHLWKACTSSSETLQESQRTAWTLWDPTFLPARTRAQCASRRAIKLHVTERTLVRIHACFDVSCCAHALFCSVAVCCALVSIGVVSCWVGRVCVWCCVALGCRALSCIAVFFCFFLFFPFVVVPWLCKCGWCRQMSLLVSMFRNAPSSHTADPGLSYRQSATDTCKLSVWGHARSHQICADWVCVCGSTVCE